MGGNGGGGGMTTTTAISEVCGLIWDWGPPCARDKAAPQDHGGVVKYRTKLSSPPPPRITR